MTTVTLKLRDRNAPLVAAWEKHFRGSDGVEISCGDIFGERADAIISPANSFGFMDGGIDLVYVNRFGWDLQERLQARIAERFAGELPVGCATLLETHDPEIPWLISAPTMRVPEDVSDTLNAYLALRAALLAVLEHNARGGSPITSVLCPGLATAIGRMPPDRAARQMAEAYTAVLRAPAPRSRTLGQIVEHHYSLKR